MILLLPPVLKILAIYSSRSHADVFLDFFQCWDH